VIHLVSEVEGELLENLNCLDALKACFPAGTVSGAPKIRAMEIIEELETNKRGPYAGAVVNLNFRGGMDSCIIIRTIVMKGNKAYIQAGAGIVTDSIPEREYEETQKKAEALIRAVKLAEEVEG
jgi:anthranilate synthase component 1